jgi:hypothetical protein
MCGIVGAIAVCRQAISLRWDEYLSTRVPSANEMWALRVLSVWADSAASNSWTSSPHERATYSQVSG